MPKVYLIKTWTNIYFYLGEDPIMSDQQQYKYMTVDDIKGLDDNIKLDTSHDDKADKGIISRVIKVNLY